MARVEDKRLFGRGWWARHRASLWRLGGGRRSGCTVRVRFRRAGLDETNPPSARRIRPGASYHNRGCLPLRWARADSPPGARRLHNQLTRLYLVDPFKTPSTSNMISRPPLGRAQWRFQSAEKPSDPEIDSTVPSITAVRTYATPRLFCRWSW